MIAAESNTNRLTPEQEQAVKNLLSSIDVLQEHPAGLDALSHWMEQQVQSVEQDFHVLEQQMEESRARLEELKQLRNYLAQSYQSKLAYQSKPTPQIIEKTATASSSPQDLLSTQQIAFFEKKVRPLLIDNCLSCHSGEKKNIKGGLNLDHAAAWQAGGDSGQSIIPGNIEDSLLIQLIRYPNEGLQMPPQGKMSDEEIHILEMWVEMGAPDPRTGQVIAKREIDIEEGKQFWSFQPIKNPSIPQIENKEWVKTGIDHFILNQLEEKQLQPVIDADKETLIRRAYYDITGLPPTPGEIDAFLQDQSPKAFELLIDRLLESPRYGERWGRHWLDVARYADSSGGGRAIMFPNAWRYRDYVIKAFNEDKPYDRFITEQIAGDLLPFNNVQERRDNLTATGYLTLGPTIFELQDKEQLDLDIVDEQLDTIGRSMLGMTVACARCHDHKFDPIPTKDYYSMAAIFKNTKSLNHANVSEFLERELPAPAEQELVYEKIDLFQNRKKQIEQQIKQLQNKDTITLKKLPGNLVDNSKAVLKGNWVTSTHTKPFVGDGYIHDNKENKGNSTVTFIPHNLAKGEHEVWLSYTPGDSRDKNVPVTIQHLNGESTVYIDQSKKPSTLDALVSLGTYEFEFRGGKVTVSNKGTTGHVIADAVVFVPKGTDIAPKVNVGEIDTTVLEQKIAALKTGIDQFTKEVPYPRPVAMAVVEKETSLEHFVHVRGSVHNKGEKVDRGFLQVASYGNEPEIPKNQSGRLQLAEWIANPNNPLTARVMANRVWRQLFGEGIVRTTDNFGNTGELPSHPELLDHLATRLVEHEWRIKPLIKEIMLSHVYQLSSEYNKQSASIDPENRLFWRMNHRRLDAEAIRDTMLYVSGNLDLSMSGSSLRKGTKSEFGYEYEENRRSVYTPVFRNSLYEMFVLFDMADPNLVNGNRTTSTLPTQSLYLMNSPFVLKESKKAASKMINMAEMSETERIQLAYRSTIGRYPTQEELKLTQDYLNTLLKTVTKEEAWSRIMQSLFGCIDFRYLN